MINNSDQDPYDNSEQSESQGAASADYRIDPDLLKEARAFFEINDTAPITYPGVIYDAFKRLKLGGEDPFLFEVDTIGRTVQFIHEQIEDMASSMPDGYRSDRATTLAFADARHKDMRDLYEKQEIDLEKRLALNDDDVEAIDKSSLELFENYMKHMKAHYLVTISMFLDGRRSALSEAAHGVAHERYLQFTGKKSEEAGELYTHKHDDRLVNAAFRNPSAFRNSLIRQLDKVASGYFDGFLKDEETAELPDIDVDFEILPNQELNFSVLPGDTNLRKLSEQIFDESSDTEKERVDIERIKILEEMRQIFGPEHCYFARGLNSGRQYENDKGELISEDFILLIMQNHNADGTVRTEDALAISPISRRHAAFYMRQDASAGISWREVFSFSKRSAVVLGARKLKFVSNEDMTPYEAVAEKVFALAACPANEFEDDLRYNTKKRIYETRSARLRRSMGQAAY